MALKSVLESEEYLAPIYFFPEYRIGTLRYVAALREIVPHLYWSPWLRFQVILLICA